jgi:UDP-GlcNAc:undecaprenyl-phosphate/decaprenyl-phosphate GlcNAc-1-phosphate transferase
LITDIGAAAACFFATLLAMAALRPVAVAVDLVDKPGGRKTHRGEVPVVGGIAMFMGCIFGLGLLPAGPIISAPMLSAAALVVLVGMLDDRFEISPVARLTAHLAAALLVLSTSSTLAIHTLGSPFGSLTQFSEWQTSAFTCVAIMGAINAFNMLDGMDGLAGTMAFNALLALVFLSGIAGDVRVAGICMVLGGAVAAFLIFNIPAKFNRRMRCFMGDAGSTLLGFMLACLCIRVSQGETSQVSPTTTLWVVAIPLYELLWTTMRRVLKGQSPFQPDRAHFHHNLLDAGFGVRGAFFVLICLGALLSAAGIAIQYLDAPDSLSFALWLVSGMAFVLLMRHARILWFVLPQRLRRVRAPELEAG